MIKKKYYILVLLFLSLSAEQTYAFGGGDVSDAALIDMFGKIEEIIIPIPTHEEAEITPPEPIPEPIIDDDDEPDDDLFAEPPTETPKDPDPCIAEAEDKLKELTQSKFTDILNKFSGPNSPYKVNISVGSLGENTALAQTSNGDYRTYNIVLNENYSDATSLSIVTSLIHEYIHAYYKTLFDDYFNNHNIHAFDDTPFLYESYVSNTYSGSREDAQHEQMAASYIDLMAATIQEFITGTAVAIGDVNSFYKDMAWGSMQGTPVYNSSILSQADRDRIGSERAAETYNKQNGENTPVGKPCNK